MDVIDQTKGTKNKLNSMTYFARMIKMDRVGFEPATAANKSVCISYITCSALTILAFIMMIYSLNFCARRRNAIFHL